MQYFTKGAKQNAKNPIKSKKINKKKIKKDEPKAQKIP